MQKLFELRRFLDAPRNAGGRKGHVCELCGALLAGTHAHVIDVEARRLMCTCRPCHLLFTHSGAAQGKFRSVPGRFLRVPGLSMGGASWEELQIPVGLAFFLRNSALGRTVLLYPSPAGATESELPHAWWEEVAAAHPVLGTMEPDVEALLVFRRSASSACWIVPVDACYELVGRIRRQWRGFEGGEQLWGEIDAFFADLEERAGEALA
jgi:Family of unknown function (DUF5947)